MSAALSPPVALKVHLQVQRRSRLPLSGTPAFKPTPGRYTCRYTFSCGAPRFFSQYISVAVLWFLCYCYCITACVPAPEEQELLALAGAVERNSTHPLAKAVVHAAGESGCASWQVEEGSFQQVAGAGARGVVRGRHVRHRDKGVHPPGA